MSYESIRVDTSMLLCGTEVRARRRTVRGLDQRARRWRELPKPASADGPGPVSPGERTPGQGSYLVACGWTPPTVPGSSRQREVPAASETASEFLAAITAELGARG